MVTFKKLDAISQSVLVMASVIFCLLAGNDWLMLSYFFVGGWQIISVITTHIFAKQMPAVFHRVYYVRSLIVLAVLGLVTIAIPSCTFFFLYGLLFISPIMAIWYITISWQEWQIWYNRSLIQLK